LISPGKREINFNGVGFWMRRIINSATRIHRRVAGLGAVAGDAVSQFNPIYAQATFMDSVV
jgi:hypothetical protein